MLWEVGRRVGRFALPCFLRVLLPYIVTGFSWFVPM